MRVSRGQLLRVVSLLSTVALMSCDGAADDHELGTVAEALQAPAPALTGSSFEIDSNANLKVDAAGTLDWGSVAEVRRADLATGQSDDSYGGGGKEDDLCPAVGTGSIPNNKSDLKYFGAYTEAGAGAGDPGFLHIFWARVQDPSGTTLMDFEFNKSGVTCANGINKNRSVGDLLIEYSIDQGGARATVTFRRWQGAVWGPATDLSTSGAAVGTLNSTAIAAADADGLGGLSARTFGEASIDLHAIFNPNVCESFGSAMLKSRSSSTFSSALKDFIAPVNVNITNCGTVIIRKQTNPDGLPGQFGFSDTLPAPAPGAFNLADNGVQTFNNVLFGSNYTVTESGQVAGFDLQGIDCSASTNVPAAISGATVTFNIDSATDVLDCTYTNRARGTIVIEKVTNGGTGTFGFTTTTLGAGFNLTTTAAGAGGKASRSFNNLAPGTYDAAESVPALWNLTSATCSDGSPPSAISLAAGETVTCTFVNQRQTGSIVIEKVTTDGAGTFGFTTNTLGAGFDLTTTAPGAAGKASRSFNAIDPGTYDAAETVPAGWDLTSATCSDGSPPSAIALSDGETVTCTFVNRRQTGTIVIEKVTTDGAGTFGFTTTTLGAGFNLTTTGPGAAGKAGRSFSSLYPGTYDAAETVPAGWVLTSATCSDGSPPSAIALSALETVTCTFVNQRQTGAIKIIKTRKHAADGPGPHPHAGVTFTVAGGSLAAPVQVVTAADGTACLSGVLLSSFVGGYTVTETVPAGYVPDGALTKDVSVVQASTCGDGREATVTFSNTPLTNVTVSVDSIVPGGTASTMTCTRSNGAVVGAGATGAGGDGSLTLPNLVPDVYTCTINVDP